MAFQQGSFANLLMAPMRPGRVVWIGVRPSCRGPVHAVDQALLDVETGLIGDHYANRSTRTRQVTLIAQEAVAAIASYLGRQRIDPAELRRNIVVAGLNLHALKGRSVRIGPALLAITGECHPCSRMEETFGMGGYQAVRGHGGVTARIIEGGLIKVGDPVAAADRIPDQA